VPLEATKIFQRRGVRKKLNSEFDSHSNSNSYSNAHANTGSAKSYRFRVASADSSNRDCDLYSLLLQQRCLSPPPLTTQ
jgi:hypothetical protein